MPQGVVFHIHAVYTDFSCIRIIEPGNQLHKAGLSAAGGTDNSDCLSRLYMERNIGKHFFPSLSAVFKIGKGNVPEFNIPSRNNRIFSAGLFIRQIDFRIQYFCNTFQTGHCPAALQQHHSHHQRHEYLYDVCGKRRQISYRHSPCQNLPAAYPDYRQRGNIHSQHHNRHIQNHYLKCTQPRLFQLLIGYGKFFRFKLISYKRFDNPYIRQHFLYSGIDRIDLFLYDFKPRESNKNYRSYGRRQHRNDNKQNHRQLGVHNKSHNDRTDQHAGRPEHQFQPHRNDILHLGNIVRQSGHKRTGTEPVNILKREFLNFAKQIAPQICSKADGRPGRKISASNAPCHHHQCRQ